MDFQAFLITFREGLEALLIIGIINTYLKKINQTQYTKWVWTGAFGAVVSSLLVALVFQVVLTGFASMGSQNYMKLGIMLVSSVLLTQMIFWMNENNKDVHSKTQDKLSKIVTTGSVLGMVAHAYLVVLREGVETVFFFAAITGGDITRAMESQGALIGLITAIVVGFLMFKGLVRFPLKTFFKVTGILIMLIAAGMLVQAIGIMQDLGMMGSAMPHVYNIVGFMPEHPIDAAQYFRDTGHQPLINGDVGIFMKAMFGYSHNPSIEELLAYLGYFLVIILWVRHKNQQETDHSENPEKKNRIKSTSKSGIRQSSAM